jgi:hypothetical protein
MHVQEPDDVAAVRAAVLVPALLGAQRQLPEERAGHADPVRARRRGRGWGGLRPHAGYAGHDRLHCAVLHLVGTGRGAGRPLRQGLCRRTGQARRDPHRRSCRHRLLPAFGGDPVRYAVLVRDHVGSVRAGEVRHPAREARDRRTAHRQRAGGRRNLPCDPDRHHRRRHCGIRGQEPGDRGRRDFGARGGVLDLCPHDPCRWAGRA